MASYNVLPETIGVNPAAIVSAINAAFTAAGIDLEIESDSVTPYILTVYRTISGVRTAVCKINDTYPVQVSVQGAFTTMGSTSYFGLGVNDYVGVCTTTNAVALVFGASQAAMWHHIIFSKNSDGEPVVFFNATSGTTTPVTYPQIFNAYVKVLDTISEILVLGVTTSFVNNVFSAFEIPCYIGTKVPGAYRCVTGLSYYSDATIGKVNGNPAALINGVWVLLD